MYRDDDFIRFDWAVKHMLRDKANFAILEGLITVLLGEKVTIEEILESESNQDDSTDKFNRVDVKAKNDKGEIIIVEVQLTRQYYYLERILYGVSKAIVEHIDLGQTYDNVKKVYSISILYCDMGTGDDYVYHGTTEFRGLNTGNSLQINTRERNAIGLISPGKVMPEFFIIRVNQFSKIPENWVDEWVEYLKTGRVRENAGAPGLPEVREKLRVLKMDVDERRRYDRYVDARRQENAVLDCYHSEGFREGVEVGLEQGLERGREEGREEQSLAIAKNLIAAGLDVDTVARATGLSLEAIKSLAGQNL